MDVLKRFNIEPNDVSLFEHAFSHSSFVNENRGNHVDYERIEFIGDGVLDLVVADLIFKTHTNMDQGLMSKLRSSLVRKESLASYARKLGLGEAILLGHGEKLNGGSNLDKILEDVFESFIGAIYLDQGFEVVYRIIKDIFTYDIEHFSVEEVTDYKSRLQEYVQADTRENVIYRVIKESGSSQDKLFVVEVLLDGNVWGVGSGKNKKKAEQNAAKDALSKVAR
jgi:ribonuclease-3